MNKDKVKEILDKSNISVIDELNILDYIDVLDNRIDKAIEYINKELEKLPHYLYEKEIYDVLNILRGTNEED